MTVIEGSSSGNAFDKPPKQRRRASLQTAFFSLATTSDYFRQIKFKPMKIIGVLYLGAAEPSVERIRSHTVERLLQYPRFSSSVSLDEDERCVMFTKIPREKIDMDYHFQVVDGKGGFSEEENISEMVSVAHLHDWDRSKPLWKILLVRNMKGGRSLICSIVDHSIGDGASMAAIMASLFDKHESGASPKKSKSPKQKYNPNNLRLSHRVISYLYACYFGTIGLALSPPDPDNCLKFSAKNKRAEPKGRKCSQTKHYPLEEVRALKNRLPGATLNDLVTAVASMAIRRYYEKSHDNVLKAHWRRPIHLTYAINHRPPTTTIEDLQTEGGSNHIVAGRFRVPLDCSSPIDTVWRCKSEMDLYKHTPIASISWMVSSFAIRCLPWKVLETIALGVFFKPTGSISNVMGPTQESSLAGYTIDDFSFYGTAAGQGFYLGVVTYCHRLRMCICMDKHVDADPDDFRECLEAAYDELKSAIEGASPTELSQPDMTPLSAWILEWSLPVLLMLWMFTT